VDRGRTQGLVVMVNILLHNSQAFGCMCCCLRARRFRGWMLARYLSRDVLRTVALCLSGLAFWMYDGGVRGFGGL